MKLNAEKIEILKSKVKLTVSLECDKHDGYDRIEKVHQLLNIAIKCGASRNILKQVLTDNGIWIAGDKHTFY